MNVRFRVLVVAGAVAAAAAAALGAPAAPVAGAGQASAAVADPMAVYFQRDAVGANMRALAVSNCGTERWSVKTMTDNDRKKVDLHAKRKSVKYLRRRNRPSSLPDAGRVGPVELTTYRVHANLVTYVQEPDGDDHLVLSKHGRTMIAEIPAPSCVGSISPVKHRIRKARHRMNAHYSVTTSFKDTHRKVVVTGVGFWDFPHGQTGAAPNNIELHPVTGLRFP